MTPSLLKSKRSVGEYANAKGEMSLRKQINHWLRSKLMPPAAAFLGFLEGSFVLFPMEPLFLPVMIARKRGAFMIAAFLLVGNVAGAALMYWLGANFAAPIIEPFTAWLGAEEKYAQAAEALREDGFWTLFLIGITPFPFQLGTAAAGAVGYAFPVFLLAVTLSRGLRYFALAAVIVVIGARAKTLLERHEAAIFIAGVVLFAALSAWMMLGTG